MSPQLTDYELETAARACRALAHREQQSAATISDPALRGPVQKRRSALQRWRRDSSVRGWRSRRKNPARAYQVTLEENYSALSMETLQQYLERNQEENLHIEFKLLSRGDLPTKDDRKSFASVVSGFANASGGLVVWGVEARKNSENIDCVTSLPGVSRIAALLPRLNELTGEAASPIVSGVQHRLIGTISADTGFAVTLVPESDSGPHMAKLGEDRYYKRSGDSFYRMEHYDLADMFGRRPKPLLDVTIRTRNPGPVAEIIVGLENKGRASALAPYLSIGLPLPFRRNRYGIDGNRGEGLPFLTEQTKPEWWSFGAGTNFVLHPGVKHEVASFTREGNVTPLPDDGVNLMYVIACVDQPLDIGFVGIPKAQLE
jgi:hypothetical protein